MGSIKTNLKKVFSFFGKHTVFWFIVGFFCSVFLGFIELFITFFIQIFLKSLGFLNIEIKLMGYTIPDFPMIYIISFLFIIGFFRFLGQFISSCSATYALEYLVYRIKILTTYDLLFNSSKKINSSGDVNFYYSSLIPATSTFISNSISFFSIFIQSISVLVIMFLTAWKETLFSCTGLGVIGIIALILNRRVRKISKVIPMEQYASNCNIEKISKNLLFINIMGTNDDENNKIIVNNVNASRHAIRASLLTNFASTWTIFLGIVLLVIVVYLSQYFWKTQSVILISFIYLLVRFIQNFGTLINLMGALNINLKQFLLTFEYFYQVPDLKRNQAMEPASYLGFLGSSKPFILPPEREQKKNELIVENTNPSPKIIFQNVTFEYEHRKSPVISNFSLNIIPGEQVGIVGKSGTGKTTLLMLLLGMYKPTNDGIILVDNFTPEKFFKDKSNRVGYVGAEPFLIRGSIYENLTYGIKITVSEEQIWECLKQVSFYDYVKKVGLEYILSEGAGGLSAGQKQRLCLARSLLNKPNLLVLDEATANLDEKTELEVAESINLLKGKCTTIIVSHRKGILKYADNICYLDP